MLWGLRCLAVALAALAALPGSLSAQVSEPLVHVTPTDYPAEVGVGRDVHHVVLAISLEADGRVTECRVVRSSGEPRLDSESCRILRERAVLRPDEFPRRRIAVRWYPEQRQESLGRRGEPLLLSIRPLIWNDDYPLEAIRRNERGAVAYSVRVSSDGRPLSCTVDSSSGSAALDRQTCALVMRRANFIPQVDDQGRRITGTYRGRVAWSL
jgi:TonB family protein